MNIDSQAVTKFQSELKAKFTKKDKSDDVKRLLELHVHRMNDGVEFGLQTSRTMYAIDQAYDISQKQISPTLMRDLIDRNPTDSAEVENLVKSFRLDSMLQRIDDVSVLTGKKIPGSKPKPGYLLQAPVFFQVLLPLLQSYLKTRWAKLFNDRDLYPLYKYEGLGMSLADRSVAKVTTQRIQRMSTEMGYRMVERDSIQKMLLYGQAINFPREPWYKETQIVDGKEKIVKEGVRFDIPHPTRVFYDRAHPLYTLNTDTGVEWVGYWNMVRYGDILSEEKYWLPDEARIRPKAEKKKGKNPKQEQLGLILPTGWRNGEVFSNLYTKFYPCTIAFPSITSAYGISDNDRQKNAFCYNGDSLDVGIDITVLFHKLNPKRCGLYDYDHMVWHRFVYAGGYHLLYCEPVFYTPAVAYLYDYDAERARNSSLGLELMPFQDHLGNLLTQQLLTVKKNLLRIVAVNTDVVGVDFQTKVVNTAENALRGLEIFTYSGMALKDQQSDISQAFYPVPLPSQQVSEVMATIGSLIGILERALGYSAQEVGAPASHQQSAAEVSVLAGASTTRMAFTGSFVDDGMFARKKLLFYAMLHYSSDEEFTVSIQRLSPSSEKALKAAGFQVTMDDDEPGLATVKGKKSNLKFENLFSERDGQSRSSDLQTAQLLQSFLDRLMANPAVGQQLPLKYVFKFYNAVAEYLGLPEELRLPEDIEQQNQEQANEQQKQLQAAIAQAVEQLVGPPMEQVSQAVAQLGQQVGQSEQAIEAVAAGTKQNDEAIVAKQMTLEQSMQILLQKLDQIVLAASTPPPGG